MRIVLSNSSGVPMYEQIKTQVRSAIHGGDITEGELLPSLRQLAAQLRVSVITVTRAYNDLVAEGLVVNEHGRGFVVRPVDTATANKALTERACRATEELIAAARAARMTMHETLERVEQQWNRH